MDSNKTFYIPRQNNELLIYFFKAKVCPWTMFMVHSAMFQLCHDGLIIIMSELRWETFHAVGAGWHIRWTTPFSNGIWNNVANVFETPTAICQFFASLTIWWWQYPPFLQSAGKSVTCKHNTMPQFSFPHVSLVRQYLLTKSSFKSRCRVNVFPGPMVMRLNTRFAQIVILGLSGVYSINERQRSWTLDFSTTSNYQDLSEILIKVASKPTHSLFLNSYICSVTLTLTLTLTCLYMSVVSDESVCVPGRLSHVSSN